MCIRQVTAAGNRGLTLRWGRSPGINHQSQKSLFGRLFLMDITWPANNFVTWPANKYRYRGLRQPEKVPQKSGHEHRG